jgi:hypothetical protein
MVEAQLEGVGLVFGEFLRRHESSHRQVLLRGLEILAEGHDFDSGRTDVAKGLAYFVRRLAQAEHDSCLDPTAAGRTFVAARHVVASITSSGGVGQQL